MKVCHLFILSIFLSLLAITTTYAEEIDSNEPIESHRDEKLFFFIKILAEECNTGIADTPTGTCLEYKQCRKFGGTSTSRCAKGLGTCCLLQKTCGQTTSRNNTFFVNPGFPEPYFGGGTCQLTVNRATTNICQIRIDFESFNLAQPSTTDGVCNTDLMTVTGGTSSVPTLCGYNTGQHIYLNVDPNGSAVKILIDADTNTETVPRIFNLKVTQIPCNSVARAPSGCLQYFATTSGTVQSFNFPIMPQTTFRNNVTRQIADTQYGVCVRPEAGYCKIAWSPDTTFDPFNFFLTGNGPSIDEAVLGQIEAATFGSSNCITDYVLIPEGQFTDSVPTATTADRFCGAAFPNPVTSAFQPFTMFVKTDSNELADAGNFGFSLNFRQTLC